MERVSSGIFCIAVASAYVLASDSLADSALNDKTPWNGVSYNFVMGVHPHNAKEYTDEVEAIILEAMKHVRLGIGLRCSEVR